MFQGPVPRGGHFPYDPSMSIMRSYLSGLDLQIFRYAAVPWNVGVTISLNSDCLLLLLLWKLLFHCDCQQPVNKFCTLDDDVFC